VFAERSSLNYTESNPIRFTEAE